MSSIRAMNNTQARLSLTNITRSVTVRGKDRSVSRYEFPNIVLTIKKTNAVVYVIFASFSERARGDFCNELLVIVFFRYAAFSFIAAVCGSLN